MRAGLISFAGNATIKFPFDIIIKTATITTTSGVANRLLQVAGSDVAGAVITASKTDNDLLGNNTTGATTSRSEPAVPGNTAITISGGLAGDTVILTWMALP